MTNVWGTNSIMLYGKRGMYAILCQPDISPAGCAPNTPNKPGKNKNIETIKRKIRIIRFM